MVWTASCPERRRNHAIALVLEDDPTFEAVLLEVLADEGLEPRACESYQALRDTARTLRPAVIVADYWGKGHLELSPDERGSIRELGQFAPTLLLTGRTWALTARAEDLGVVSVLAKPVDLDQLMAGVGSCLARAHPS